MCETKLLEIGGEEVKKELKWFRDTLSNSYGPWSYQALLISAPSGGGGALTLTRRSSKLFQLLHIEHPLTKHIVSHLQGHAHCYRDSTLYAGMLGCNLILRGMRLPGPRRTLAMAISKALSMVGEWLEAGVCPVRLELDLSHVQQLLTLVISYLGAKMSVLSQQELRHLATLLVKGFLRALPSEGNPPMSILEQVYFLPASCVLSGSTHQSSLHEGLLVSLSMCPSLLSLHGRCGHREGGRILTVVLDASLAGGLAEGSEFSVVSAVSVNTDEVIEAELIAMGHVLVERGVGLLACQKCVHPALKDYLKNKGVVVVERLSSVLLGPVHKLCGGDLLSSPSPHTLRHCDLGSLSDVKKMKVLGQWYLQLIGLSNTHSTLVLCSDLERNLDELHPLCQDALSLLESCAANPSVLCGGGCADTSIADYLRKKGVEHLSDNSQCAADVVQMVAQCFEQQASSLEKHGGQVLTDCVHHHCWIFPPPSVWDEASPSSPRSPSEGDVNKTCNCGAVSLRDIPAHITWRTLLPVDTLQPLPHLLSGYVPLSPTSDPRLPNVFDLLTPRIAALSCASEMCQTVLTTAFIITQQVPSN